MDMGEFTDFLYVVGFFAFIGLVIFAVIFVVTDSLFTANIETQNKNVNLQGQFNLSHTALASNFSLYDADFQWRKPLQKVESLEQFQKICFEKDVSVILFDKVRYRNWFIFKSEYSGFFWTYFEEDGFEIQLIYQLSLEYT